MEGGVDGVNKIWRDAKLRGVGMKRATKLVDAAGHSIAVSLYTSDAADE